MPWATPSLKEIRGFVRDNIHATLPGADASVPNSVLRVLSDAQGGLCHLTLQYVDWLSLQLLPDTAETEWLDRHGVIWLQNSDGSKGRKQATYAEGILGLSGISGTVVPLGTRITGTIEYETTAEVIIGVSPTETPARALDAGSVGNVEQGLFLTIGDAITGVDNSVLVISMTGGHDTETDSALRARILQRIQNPAMGGSQENYVTWALSCPGVTRAWAAPEQGPGTITVRFLMDEERPPDGWPLPADVIEVKDFIDTVRPVTVFDSYVMAPIKTFIDITVMDLVPESAQGAVEASIRAMLYQLAAPGQTIFAAWISYAIMNATGVQSFKMTVPTADYLMPSLGHMAVLGTLLFEESAP